MIGDTQNAAGTKTPPILVDDDGTVHVTGAVTATVDTSALATSAKQDTAQTTQVSVLAQLVALLAKLPAMLLDGANNLLVSMGTRFAGEAMAADYLAVRQRFAYVPCAATATTVVAAVPCFVHSILVFPGASGTVLVYDAASATGSAVLSITHSATAPAPFTLILDAQFTTGCTVVLGTAGTALVTAE